MCLVMAVAVEQHPVGVTVVSVLAIGALLATFIYQSFGFGFVAALALVFNIFGLLAVRRMIR